MKNCVNCNSVNLGKIAEHQYYCWNCFIEISTKHEQIEVHQVEVDGTLSSLDDLFTEKELFQTREIG